ncbi:hypothetical protein [Ekhidna sp.]|uniref:hypothetical protein n=1 Tax=Ekhidna sp. TaxID=2608089 RepID=UPI003B5012EE
MDKRPPGGGLIFCILQRHKSFFNVEIIQFWQHNCFIQFMRLTILLIPFLLISCLPARLVPQDFSIEKNNYEAYIELDSVTIALANLKAKGDHYVFGLEIENKSTQPIFIDMNRIKKFAHPYSYRDPEKKKLYQEVTSAMTPEQVDAFFTVKQQDAEAAALFLFLVGAAIITHDIIEDERDWNKSTWTEADEKKSNTRDAVTVATLMATDILIDVAIESEASAQVELHYLPNELFDREIIYPGETYFGKIFFKNFEEIKEHHRITFPLEGKNLHFDFRKANAEERRFLYEQGH